MWPYLAEETIWLDAESRQRANSDNGDPGALPGTGKILNPEEIEELVARGRVLRSRFLSECLASGARWLWQLPGRLASPARHRASLRPVGG